MIRRGLVIGESNRGGCARLASPRGRDARRPRRWPRWLAFGCVVIGLGAAGWWLTTAPLFAVERAESGRYRFASEDRVEELLGDALGRNLWALSTGEIERRAESLPWISDARIERRLPDTIVVDFHEWIPVWRLEAAERLVVLADGSIAELPDELPEPDLPVLTGARFAHDGSGGWALDERERARLLALVEAVEATGLETVRPVDFVISGPAGLSLVLQGEPGRLLLGEDNFRGRLERYLVMRDELAEDRDVDLRFRDRVLCRGARPEEREQS